MALLTLVAPDGCPVSAYDDGAGEPGRVPVVIVGGGLDDGTATARLAGRLSARRRVLRMVRRQYRPDVEAWRPVGIRDEACDVLAVTEAVGAPCYLFGHSSGGVVALEAALAAKERVAALAVFEPPVTGAGLPLGSDRVPAAAREALDAGRPGKALEIFLRDVVDVPGPLARMSRLLALVPRYRRQLIPGQVADYEALRALGDRTRDYAGIGRHVLLVTGGRSPGHLQERCGLLARTLPSCDSVRLPRAGHGAPADRPDDVADLLLADIETSASGDTGAD